MSRILIALILTTFTQPLFADDSNTAMAVEGNWRGMVDFYVEDQLEETRDVTVELSFNGTEEVIFESFFGDTASFERNGNQLFQDGNLVGSITDDRFYVKANYVNDETCTVEIDMTRDAQGRVSYWNALVCEDYYDRMEGLLEAVVEDPIVDEPVVDDVVAE